MLRSPCTTTTLYRTAVMQPLCSRYAAVMQPLYQMTSKISPRTKSNVQNISASAAQNQPLQPTPQALLPSVLSAAGAGGSAVNHTVAAPDRPLSSVFLGCSAITNERLTVFSSRRLEFVGSAENALRNEVRRVTPAAMNRVVALRITTIYRYS
eukprot:COSAG02_NODE_416_length_22749_cov_21.264059_14_plen_153_part_00